MNGFDVRGGVGLDVYLSEVFSVGGNLTGEVLVLRKRRFPAPASALTGSSVGGAATLTLVAGLHF